MSIAGKSLLRKRALIETVNMGVCVALLPILLLRDFTPSNELRYLSIADEALRNHMFFAFSNHGVPYADKPPLYLWMVMLCRWLTGAHRMWLLALFSLLPAWGIVRTMDKWVEQEMDGDSRLLAQWMLLTCGLFIGTAVTLRMDMLMCFFIVLALRTFWRMQKGEGHPDKNSWLFPLYLFLAVFSKGPIGLLVPLCGITVFLVARRRIKEFFHYWGGRTWGVLLVCCILWFGAVYAEGGADYLHDLLFRQTAGRAVHSFHHAKPFYYYAVCIWYCLAPWSLLIVGAVAAALRPKFVRSDLQCFFLIVGITTLVLLSCISSKLQIYMLPAIPFLVYATAMVLPRFRENGWMRMALAVPAAIFFLALPVLIVLTTTQDIPSYLYEGIFYAIAIVLTLCGIHSLYLLYNRKRSANITGVIWRIGVGLFLVLFLGGWALPKLNLHTGYGMLCHKALELSEERGIGEIRTWHLSRPENIDVYLHRPVTIVKGDEIPASGDKSCLLLTHSRYLEYFPGKESYIVGPYAVVLLKAKKTADESIQKNR